MATRKTAAEKAEEKKTAAEAAEIAQEAENGATGTNTQPEAETPQEGAQSGQEPQEKREPWGGYNQFVYIGPALPGGALKSNAVMVGTFAEIKAYLAPTLEQYPQAEKLIFPVEKLGEQLRKVKTPGNIANKYYTELVSLARANREV